MGESSALLFDILACGGSGDNRCRETLASRERAEDIATKLILVEVRYLGRSIVSREFDFLAHRHRKVDLNVSLQEYRMGSKSYGMMFRGLCFRIANHLFTTILNPLLIPTRVIAFISNATSKIHLPLGKSSHGE